MAAMNMQGKVCLVTGSSSGIGKVTARELARMGATVVMVCRNRAKGEAAQAEIKEASGNAQVDLIVADLLICKANDGIVPQKPMLIPSWRNSITPTNWPTGSKVRASPSTRSIQGW